VLFYGSVNFGQYDHTVPALTIGDNGIYGSNLGTTVNLEGTVTVLQTLNWNRGTVSCPLSGGQLINNGTANLAPTTSALYDYIYSLSDKVPAAPFALCFL
jgi:hypothetical protein